MPETELKLNLPQWAYWLMAILGVVGIIITVVIWLRLREKGNKKQ